MGNRIINNKASLWGQGLGKRAIVLIMVLATLLVVAILATILLNIILSHSRLTHHQVSRIQAYYAAMAGMNYTLEQLRTGAWTFSPNSCPDPAGCNLSDPDFPPTIQSVRVVFCPQGQVCNGATASCNPPVGSGINFCVNSTANYLRPGS